MKTLMKNLRKSSLKKPVGRLRGGRLELVPRMGKTRPDITVRFASKAEHTTVRIAAKLAKESMSKFIAEAALARARNQPIPVARAI
jgi:hypothetical protein